MPAKVLPRRRRDGMSPASPLRLERLQLTRFRSYAALAARFAAPIVVLAGPNGAGKTNLLEAISLLTPGRGLRGARIAELARREADGSVAGTWAGAGRFATPEGPLELGTGIAEAGASRRSFLLDGAAPRGQAEIAARVAAVWLTPQMDRLFQDGASARRRFLDRLVWAIEPAHAREVAAYETALAERNRLLAAGNGGTLGAEIFERLFTLYPFPDARVLRRDLFHSSFGLAPLEEAAPDAGSARSQGRRPLLRWQALQNEKDIDHFEMQYREDGGEWQDWNRPLQATARQAWFVGQPGRRYEFRLRAVGQKGDAAVHRTARSDPANPGKLPAGRLRRRRSWR